MNGSRNPDHTRTLRPALVALMALGLGTSSDALAQGYSTDIELVRPVFSHKGLPGIDTPLMSAQPTLRAGFMYQYERDPVILYQFGEEVGGAAAYGRRVLPGARLQPMCTLRCDARAPSCRWRAG